jgi:hypothetical protein
MNGMVPSTPRASTRRAGAHVPKQARGALEPELHAERAEPPRHHVLSACPRASPSGAARAVGGQKLRDTNDEFAILIPMRHVADLPLLGKSAIDESAFLRAEKIA